MRCSICKTEVKSNDLYIYCPACNAIDFTDNFEVLYPGLAEYALGNHIPLTQLIYIIGGLDAQKELIGV